MQESQRERFQFNHRALDGSIAPRSQKRADRPNAHDYMLDGRHLEIIGIDATIAPQSAIIAPERLRRLESSREVCPHELAEKLRQRLPLRQPP